MADSRHRVLLVEDDADTREELEEILRSLGCEVVSCDNKTTALGYLAEQAFCVAVLDLRIFGEAKAIRPNEEHGRSLLREIRRAYPHHSGSSFTFPILVVSGNAAEWESAKEVTQDGASDIIRKPPKPGEVSHSIRLHLQRSGREDHAKCARAPGATMVRKSDYELAIPAVRSDRRVEVRLGLKSALLPERLLKVLLYLVKGHLTGTPVHKSDMGDTGDRGFKLASDLNREMRSAFPPGVTAITKNHYHGNYSLIEPVTIGAVAIEHLTALGNSGITELAREIAELRSKSGGKS